MYKICVEGSIRCEVQDLRSRAFQTILFVHGWPMDKRIFENQCAVLPQYGIRCVSVDLRGFGGSDRPSRGYSYSRLADDLYKIIASLDSRSITLCGFSMGAGVCIRYMARHSGFKVGRLVLMSAAAPSFVQRPGFPYGMSTQQVDAMIAQAYTNRPQMCANFVSSCFAQDPGEEYRRWFTSLCLDSAAWAAIQTAEALRDEDLRENLQKINIPTAIYHGIYDRVCPYIFAEELQRGIANAFVVPFEKSGHCLFFEEKDKCNSSLIDFINKPY